MSNGVILLWRTFKLMFRLQHDGSRRRARSEPRGSVRGADAAAVTQRGQNGCLLYIGMPHARGWRVGWVRAGYMTLCGGSVTSLGLLPAEKKDEKHKRSTCSGWSLVDGVHVALASDEPEPSRHTVSPVRQQLGDNISMAAEMEPSE